MAYPRLVLAWATCLLALAPGCTGCAGPGETDAGTADEQPVDLFHGADILPLRGRVFGQCDHERRFPSAVHVQADASPGQHYRGCAGVVLAPNLVLTAAHCLCKPTSGETTRFDGSGCAAEATVTIADFPALVWDAGPNEGHIRTHHGNIVVHPQFKLELDAKGAIVTSRADLAVVRLKESIPRSIPPIRLARRDVSAGEVVSVVGFTYFEETDQLDSWTRCFSREEVGAPADGERVLFGSADRAGYKGDTGGPCVREAKGGSELVGISQRELGLAPTFTRIAPYREWLEEQIRLASAKR